MVKRASTHDGQLEMSFFDVPPSPAPDDGSLDMAREVREILSEVLGRAAARGTDRFEISTLISRLTDRDISKHMLDRYSSTASEDWRFPLEALPALTQATGDFALLELIAERCGCRVLRGEEAMLAEIGALMLQEKAAKARLETIRKHVPQPVMQRLIDEALKRLGRG
jgi:hypothetical protein